MTPEQVRLLLDGLVERASEHGEIREVARQHAEAPKAYNGNATEVEHERALRDEALDRVDWEYRVRAASERLHAWREATAIAFGDCGIKVPF